MARKQNPKVTSAKEAIDATSNNIEKYTAQVLYWANKLSKARAVLKRQQRTYVKALTDYGNKLNASVASRL